jgi:tRNA dimethylallyltransferase
MEVFLITGMPLSWHNAQSRLRPPRYDPLWIGLNFRDRSRLYARIDRRVDQMMDQGLEDEVRALLEKGVNPGTTAMQAIGYKEMAAALRGECTVRQAVDQIKQSSRRYAKRQLTWFRRNDKIRWLYVDEEKDLTQAALRLLEK